MDKQVKQRRESIEMFKQGKRLDLADRVTAERVVLEAYLPKQLSHNEINAEVEGIITVLGTKEFPMVMREAAAKLKWRADGKTVNEVYRTRALIAVLESSVYAVINPLKLRVQFCKTAVCDRAEYSERA